MGMTFKSGDKVQMTGKFLRSTGQYTGKDAHGKWLVVAVQGSMVLVNESAVTDYYTADEMKADPSLQYRRINASNLERVRS